MARTMRHLKQSIGTVFLTPSGASNSWISSFTTSAVGTTFGPPENSA